MQAEDLRLDVFGVANGFGELAQLGLRTHQEADGGKAVGNRHGLRGFLGSGRQFRLATVREAGLTTRVADDTEGVLDNPVALSVGQRAAQFDEVSEQMLA